MLRCCLVPFFGLMALVCLWGAKVPSTHRLDSAWKKYSNGDLGYCVSYPSRWQRGEAFDGAGMYFATGLKKYARPSGEIDISAFSDLKPVEYLKTHLEGLKKFERAEKLRVLEQREMPLLGGVALFTKDTYFDPLDSTDWMDEMVLAKYQGMLYRLELECRADQVSRFEPVFAQFVQSFRFDCASK
jgi:hypothetical protein